MGFWKKSSKDARKKRRRGSSEGVDPVGLQIGEDGVELATNLPGGTSVSSDGDIGYRPPGSSLSFDPFSRDDEDRRYGTFEPDWRSASHSTDHGNSSNYGSGFGSGGYSSGSSSYDSGSSGGSSGGYDSSGGGSSSYDSGGSY